MGTSALGSKRLSVRARLLFPSLALGMSLALLPTGALASPPPPTPPPAPTSGTVGPTQAVVSTGLAYRGSNAPSGPPPSNSAPAPSCSGPGWEYYSLTVTGINRSVMSGVNVKMVSGVALEGGSPSASNINYSVAPFTKLNTYPSQVSPAQDWFAAWEGTWKPVWSTPTVIYAWVASSPPVTKASYSQPAGTATTKWVADGSVRAGRQSIPLWLEYIWEPDGSAPATQTGCSLQQLGPQYFFPETYCTSPSCVAPYLPSFPTANQMADKLIKSYSGGQVVSAPPSQAITVWVPTTFSLANANLPPVNGATDIGSPQPVSLPDGRSLQVQLEIGLVPLYTNWTYVASGAQSGPGFTCTVQTPPYQSYNGQNLSNCNLSPNIGYPSSAGYVFTHDATRIEVTAVTYIGVAAYAIWSVNGGPEQSYPVQLNSNVAAVPSAPEIGRIQQVEGVTVPSSGGQG